MIPLNIPNLQGNEWEYLKECLDTNWVSSAGKFVDLFEHKIAEYCGVKHAISSVNGTSALHIALKVAGVKANDEVLVPTITFIAPVNTINYSGAYPVFMDVDEFYNLDIDKTIEFIETETYSHEGNTYNRQTLRRISAILPVHMWGNAVDIGPLLEICNEKNIAIVEDASESLGTSYRRKINGQKHTGTVGLVGCISFNGNKIITTGGGGMILTNDDELAKRAKYLTTQAKDDEIRYVHHEVGYNYRMTNIQAALGVAQLEQLEKFLEKKRNIHHRYDELLASISGITLVGVPEHAINNHWLNIIRIDVKEYGIDRETVMVNFSNNKIQTRPVWYPNHLQRPYSNCQGYKIDKAERLVDESLCLPSSTTLDRSDDDHIAEILVEHHK